MHLLCFSIFCRGLFDPFSLLKDSVSPPKKICTLVQGSAEDKTFAPERKSTVESLQSIFLDFHSDAVFAHFFLSLNRTELNLNALASVSGRKRFIAKEKNLNKVELLVSGG